MAQGLPPDARPPRILIIDDHEDNLILYAQYLAYEGFEVHTAGDGLEAVRHAQGLRPDLIVMDLALPKMDGWTATRRLKRDPRTRHIPVIALTGHALMGEDRKAKAAGCDLFLVKPCLPDELVQAIRRLLTRPPSQRLHPRAS